MELHTVEMHWDRHRNRTVWTPTLKPKSAHQPAVLLGSCLLACCWHAPAPDNPTTPAALVAAAAPPAHLPGARPSPAHRRPTTPATPAPAAPLHHKTAACCLPASAVGRPSTSAAPAACVPHLAQHPNPASFRPGLFASIVQCSHYNGHRLNPPAAAHWPPLVRQPVSNISIYYTHPAPPQWPAPLPSLAIQILSLRTISSRNAESPPPSDCPRHHHNLHHLPRLSIRQTSLYPKTGPTAHILRLPTPLTFFCEPGCALLRTHAPVPLDDPPNRNLCKKIGF
ncbi:hypothetical protein C8J57DRAFT_1601600 [Mycena rebaudengoi]|nr:hypothetical protein C8J57DRAFT_1601600 [Mycena rebaudengoi]